MNRSSTSHFCILRKFTIVLFSLFLLGISLSAQTYAIITQVEFLPTNPDSETPVSVQLTGVRTNSCSYLNTSTINVNASFTVLNMDWNNQIDDNPTASCSSFSIPWDTTFQLGILSGGAHGFYFAGNNYALSGLTNPQTVQVSDNNCVGTGNVITVTNNQDEGEGSLRQAIICANNTPGANRIVFDLPGFGPDTIRVGGASGLELPALLDDSTTIDATTHQAFGLNGDFSPRVVLDGQFNTWETAINAIWVRGDYSEIYGLEIINFPDDGIDVVAADFVKIGAPNKGNVIHDNGAVQDFFPGNPGSGPWEGCGVVIRGGSIRCTVQGNYIGTNYAETTPNGNEFCGILIRDGGDNNVIGGNFPGSGNVIVNNAVGVSIRSGSMGCSLLRNSFYCNDTIAVELRGTANGSIAAPVITTATSGTISGTALINQTVNVYINENNDCVGAPCQGKIYLGSANVINGNWSINFPFANNVTLDGGDQVTAITTDLTGNSSVFASCVNVVSICGSNNGLIAVTNTNDGGPGSLRAAIDCANSLAGANQIHFNIPGAGPHVIAVGTNNNEGLPALFDNNTIIDATTQPGFNSDGTTRPVIILDGAAANWDTPFNAIWVRGNSCEIYGLEIRNFPDDGIDLTAASFAQIGAAGKGNVIYNCGLEQDFFSGIPNTGPWNGCGIVVRNGASNNQISGNTIGTNFDQTNTQGNEYCGIYIRGFGDNNRIGDGTFANKNIIANNPTGVRINTGSIFCQVSRNQFICNDTSAIDLIGTANNNVGAPVVEVIDNQQISGVGNGRVEVYVSNADDCNTTLCQGRIYLGMANTVNGEWMLNEPFDGNYELNPGDQITAIAILPNGNTSEFANCATFVGCDLMASASEIGSANCGEDNGSLGIVVTGGTAPFTYRSNGMDFTNPIINNLPAGTATVLVTDSNNCTSTVSVTIPIIAPPTLTLISQTDATCGQPNGAFALENTGGIGPFTFSINNEPTNSLAFEELVAGTYLVELEDAIGCSTSITVTIAGSSMPIAVIAQVTPTTCGNANGGFLIAVMDGTAPFNYFYNNINTNNPNFENLAAGTYTVQVTDANNCTTEVTAIINTSTPLLLAVGDQTDATCGQSNGAFTLGVSGGTAPFIFITDDFSTSNPIFDQLPSGTYSVTVNDANNCMATVTATIADSPAPLIAISQLTMASCGLTNGSFTVAAVNGLAPYQYSIGNGFQNSGMFENLTAGIYQIAVIDNNGCVANLNAIVGDTPPVELTITETMVPTCGIANGMITVTAMGGTGNLNYSLNEIPQSSNQFTALVEGAYTILVTDEVGCTASQTTILTTTGVPIGNISAIANDVCNERLGSFTVEVTGGTSPYTFDIGSGTTADPVFTNLFSGSYQVSITDAIGCTSTVEAIIEDQSVDPVSSFSFTRDGSSLSFFSSSTGADSLQWEFGDGSFSMLVNPTHNYLQTDIYTVCLTAINNCASDISCQPVEVLIPLSNYSIGGNIARTDGITVGQVEVSCTDASTMVTTANGNYFFDELPEGNPYTVTPFKDIFHNNGITVTDILKLQEHLLVIDTFDSAYEVIAADVNHNGVITVADIIDLREVILVIQDRFNNNNSWRFVPETYSFAYPTQALAHNYPESITIDELTQDESNQDFIAIKIGDINNSSIPNAINPPTITWTIPDRSLQAGEIVDIPIYLKNAESLAGFQSTMFFDTTVLTFVEQVEGTGTTGLSGLNARKGQLRTLWYDETGNNGVSIGAEERLYTLRFKVHQSVEYLSEVLTIPHLPGDQLAVLASGQNNNIELEFTPEILSGITNELSQYATKLYPNPFSEQTTLIFDLVKPSPVILTIFDDLGRRVFYQTHQLNSGPQRLLIDGGKLPANGIYFYELKIDDHTENGKFIYDHY